MNCNLMQIILGVIILVFALWATAISGWIIVIAAILIIVHGAFCKNCYTMELQKSEAPKKKRR